MIKLTFKPLILANRRTGSNNRSSYWASTIHLPFDEHADAFEGMEMVGEVGNREREPAQMVPHCCILRQDDDAKLEAQLVSQRLRISSRPSKSLLSII